MRFNDYNHFYCYTLKIMENRGYEVTDEDKQIMREFEKIYSFINNMVVNGMLYIKRDPLITVSNYFKKTDNISHYIYAINYMRKRYKQLLNGEINIYYLYTSLNSMLKLDIDWNNDFINTNNKEDILYPSRIPSLLVEKGFMIDERKLDSMISNSNYLNIPGIYMIHEKGNGIVYIGKSTSCVLQRSIQSVRERRINELERIVLFKPKTRSDVGVYEAYYIAKYKPMLNKDMIFDDEVSIELPDLEPVKTITIEDRIKILREHNYFLKRVVDVNEYFQSESLILDCSHNKKYLESQNIFEKHKRILD